MKTQLAAQSPHLFIAIKPRLSARVMLSFFLTATLAMYTVNALAEKPEGVGQGKYKEKGEKGEKGHSKNKDDRGQGGREPQQQGGGQIVQVSGGGRVTVNIGGYFQPQQRTAVQAYYGPILQSGRCPPGLAKKNNGCMPPGQAKAYTLGRPLPSQVVFYDVPSSVSVQIGLPPAGHRYVRVAADILLIAVGTGMVVDAIEDLGRL